jgi:hypothetical protein
MKTYFICTEGKYFRDAIHRYILTSIKVKLREGERYTLREIDVPQYRLSKPSLSFTYFVQYRNVAMKCIYRSGQQQNRQLLCQL